MPKQTGQQKYKLYSSQCKKKNQSFTDPEFPPQQFTKLSHTGRKIIWKRLDDLYPNWPLFSQNFSPDVHTANINDKYLLASISSLAEVPQRIQKIFLNQKQKNGYGLYRLLVCRNGYPEEIIIDDKVPVFEGTLRPVFSKAVGQQIWPLLVEKAWAKIKGSYDNIVHGSCYQIMKTFSIAPCFSYAIDEKMSQQSRQDIWSKIQQAKRLNCAICIVTTNHPLIKGLRANQTYNLLECQQINGGSYPEQLVKMFNPHERIQDTGEQSLYNSEYWNKAPNSVKQRFSVKKEGQFVLPFRELLRNFESICICHDRNNFSIETLRVRMENNVPFLFRLVVDEDQQGYIKIQKQVDSLHSNQKQGYLRLIMAHQFPNNRQGQGIQYEYYASKFVTSDSNLSIHFPIIKKGVFILYLQASFAVEKIASVSYYFKSNYKGLDVKKLESITKFPSGYPYSLLKAVFVNHAYRTNCETTKIGPSNGDWIKSKFLYEEGGLGYIVCNLDSASKIML